MTKIKITGSDRILWVAVFPVLAVGLIFLGVLYYNYDVVRLQDEKYGEISAIAKLKFDSLLDWRNHRLADVRRASLGPLVRKEIGNFLNDPSNNASKAVLKLQLNINRKTNIYADAYFLDKSGAMLLSDNPDPPPIDKATKNAVEIAFKERKEVMSDFFRSAKDIIYIDAVAPVYDPAGSIMAFMILRSNAADYLFPLIQTWPTPSKTAETLLVRRDGDFVLFLNELRHMQNTALTLRMPVTTDNLTAAQAIFGKYGRFHGKDYRGVNVLAMILPVPETGWFMVAKVDSDEILSEVKYRAWVITLFVFLLIIILGGAVNVFYRNRNAADRKKADDALHRSEATLRALIDAQTDSVLLLDTHGVILEINNIAADRLGKKREEVIGTIADNHLPEDVAKSRRTLISQCIDTGKTVSFEDVHNGIWFETIAHAVKDKDNEYSMVVVVGRDITGRKLAEEALRISEERYRRITNSITDYIYTVRVKDGVAVETKHGPGCYAVTGYYENEFAEDSFLWIRMVAPEDRSMVEEQAKRILAGEFASPIEHRIIHKNGMIRWVRNTSVLQHDEHGILSSYDGLIQNITERKQAEEAMRESEERYRIAIESANDGVTIVQNEIHVFVNWKFLNIFGYSSLDEIAGKPRNIIVHPDFQEQITGFARARENGDYAPKRYEFKGVRKDGIIIDIEVSATTIIYKGEKAILAYMRDVTERKQAEKALRESEARLDSIIRGSPMPQFVIDRNHMVIHWNDALEKYSGIKAKEIIGTNKHWSAFYRKERPCMADLLVDDELEKIHQWYEGKYSKSKLIEGGYEATDFFQSMGGSGSWLYFTAVPIRNADGSIIGAIETLEDITERKLAEEALRESEQRFRSLIDHSYDAVFIHESDGRLIDVNKTMLKMYGVSYDEALNYIIDDYTGPQNSMDEVRNRWKLTLAGEDQFFPWQARRPKDGSLFDVEVFLTRITIGSREIILANVRDITERKQAEQALREHQQMFIAFVESSQDWIWALDLTGKHTYSNYAIKKILGYSPAEFQDMGMDLLHPEDRRFVDARWPVWVEAQEGWQNLILRWRASDGSYHYLESTAMPILGPKGELHGFRGVDRDITERKRTEDALRESEEIFSQFMEHSPVYVFFKDDKIRSLRLSNNYEKMLGKPLTELLGKTMDDLFPSDLAKKMIEDDKSILKEGKEITLEEEFNGRYYSTIKFPIYIENKPPLLAGYTIDVTEEKQAQDTLIKEKEKFYTYIENAPFGMMLITENGTISYINQKFKEILGYELSDIPDGRTWFRKAYPDKEYRHEVISAWQIDLEKRMIGEQIQRVYTAECKDGSRKAINFLTAIQISGEYLMACEDITLRLQAEEEKRKLEERLTRAEKMEAIGTLAGGVAHDLNNVLGVLIGYAELLFDEKDEANRKEFLTNIIDGGRKAAAMVEDMLTMTRRGVASREVLNLNTLIADFENSLAIKSLLNNHAFTEMKIDLDSDLLNISGSRVHLEKMLFNLILNAFEAMPKGGSLTINTANYYLEKPIAGYDEVKQGEYVVLSIADTGIGISATDIKRIFEPFYTKKTMGRSGTGLGLAVVWGTVKDHNGYINVNSEEGKGSTFTIYFPVSREEITADSVSVSIAEYMGKGESILVVDDVKGQRELAAQMLKKLNYKVTVVASGEEAVENIKKHPVDLVLLDMIMDPGMDGLDTYKNILEIRPKQKAIIVSGFSETDRVDAAQAAGAGAYVKKPYVIEKFGLAVRNELDRSA